MQAPGAERQTLQQKHTRVPPAVLATRGLRGQSAPPVTRGHAAGCNLAPCNSAASREQLGRNSFKHPAELTRTRNPRCPDAKDEKPRGVRMEGFLGRKQALMPRAGVLTTRPRHTGIREQGLSLVNWSWKGTRQCQGKRLLEAVDACTC